MIEIRKAQAVRVLALFATGTSAQTFAADPASASSWSVGGLAFGDVYYVDSHHTESGAGASGAVLRRLYLTLDGEFGDGWVARIRTETNQSGEFETYTFDTEFKDVYIGRRMGRHSARLGLSPTPTFDVIEDLWGLRYLARTPMDLQGIASRDTGAALQGSLDVAGAWQYRAMVGAGVNFGNETGDGVKWMAALSWRPSQVWVFDAYADYERLPGPTDRSTWQLFAGHDTEALRWGVQYSNQDRQEDPPLELASAFVVGRLNDRASAIGRVDRIIEPSVAGNNIAYLPFDPSAPATMIIGGLELRLTDRFTLTPNVVSTHYDRNDDGVRPMRDLHLRLTFFLDME